MIKASEIYELGISLVYPRRCPVCDGVVNPFGELVCDACRSKVRYVHGAVCCKCGKPLDESEQEYCEDCSGKKHAYIRGKAVFEYKSVADSIYRFKYCGRREYAAWYGREMYNCLGDFWGQVKPDAFIPVPIHKSKLRSRGYNQAQLIAEELSKWTGIPTNHNLIRRERKTTPLKDLAPGERNNILRGAFKLTGDDVKLSTIVIIDDIYTTGATMDAVASALTGVGIKKIYCATLAIGKGV